MSQGSLALVLHAHLPFVRHPEHESFLEEDWLYESISETYLPLLDVFDRCAGEGIPFRVTMTLTPTLVSMLRDDLLKDRYSARLDRLCELTDKEVHRTKHDATYPLHRFVHWMAHEGGWTDDRYSPPNERPADAEEVLTIPAR